MRKMDFLDTLRHDLGFALRQLRKSPGFATITVLTVVLALAAALASVFPARRATRVDPIRVLKAE